MNLRLVLLYAAKTYFEKLTFCQKMLNYRHILKGRDSCDFTRSNL
jgi:hypothetical protein